VHSLKPTPREHNPDTSFNAYQRTMERSPSSLTRSSRGNLELVPLPSRTVFARFPQHPLLFALFRAPVLHTPIFPFPHIALCVVKGCRLQHESQDFAAFGYCSCKACAGGRSCNLRSGCHCHACEYGLGASFVAVMQPLESGISRCR